MMGYIMSEGYHNYRAFNGIQCLRLAAGALAWNALASHSREARSLRSRSTSQL